MNGKGSPAFERYIGIDYSGAQTPTSSLKGLCVFVADRDSAPVEIKPPPSPRKYWSRRGVTEWLVDRLSASQPALVGIDHGFSFPLRYFETHHLAADWGGFLDDFQGHWPTDEDQRDLFPKWKRWEGLLPTCRLDRESTCPQLDLLRGLSNHSYCE